MTLNQIENTLNTLLDYLYRTKGIDLDVDVVIDYHGTYPNLRNYAKTTGDIIYFSPKILRASEDRLQGLLRHELAHVLLIQGGDFDHSEAYADEIAESFFGKPIFYDRQDVQCVSGGVRPRPLYLPQ
jgi:hypothetical protein